jgi:cell division protease FtsH
MKFAASVVAALLVADGASAFTSHFHRPMTGAWRSSTSRRYMAAMDVSPPPNNNDLPVLQANSYGPTEVRYSDFLKLVNADRIEKVTFSSDGTQLLGVDVDGVRLAIEALPNDPDLLTQLTQHKVRASDRIEACRACSLTSLLACSNSPSLSSSHAAPSTRFP